MVGVLLDFAAALANCKRLVDSPSIDGFTKPAHDLHPDSNKEGIEAMVRKRHGLLAVFAALCISGSVSAQKNDDIPDALYSLPAQMEGRLDPIWVSVEYATDAKGGVKWEVLGEDARENYNMVMSHPADVEYYGVRDGCADYGPFDPGEPIAGIPRDSLAGLVRSSRAVVGGTVIAVAPGFYSRTPATMMNVRVDHQMKQSEWIDSSTHVYVPYPYAKFRIGDACFLSEDPNFPIRPSVGDRVVLFANSDALDTEERLIRPDHDLIALQTPAGRMFLPRVIENSPDGKPIRDLDDLVEKASRLVTEEAP